MDPRDAKHMHPKLDSDAEAAPGSATAHHPQAESDAHDLLAEVHTRVRDTIAGLEKLHEKAEPDFRPVAQQLLSLHRRHSADLEAHLADVGHEAQEDGSFFSTVNRAVIEIRSWFDDISDNVMSQVKEGEKHVLEAYENAKGDPSQPDAVRDTLSRHITEIDAAMQKHA